MTKVDNLRNGCTIFLRRGGIHAALVFRVGECSKDVVGATIGRPVTNKRGE